MPTPLLALGPVRTAIAAKIDNVAGTGVVHDYERFSNAQKDLRTLYQEAAGDPLLGFFVSLQTKRERAPEYGQRWICEANWKVVGYMALNDAKYSEKVMSDLLDALGDAFRADDTLGGAVMSCINDNNADEAGLQVDALEHVLFCDVLCHRARGRLFTRMLF